MRSRTPRGSSFRSVQQRLRGDLPPRLLMACQALRPRHACRVGCYQAAHDDQTLKPPTESGSKEGSRSSCRLLLVQPFVGRPGPRASARLLGLAVPARRRYRVGPGGGVLTEGGGGPGRRRRAPTRPVPGRASPQGASRCACRSWSTGYDAAAVRYRCGLTPCTRLKAVLSAKGLPYPTCRAISAIVESDSRSRSAASERRHLVR